MASASPSLAWGLVAGAIGFVWGLSEIIDAFKNETGRALRTGGAWLLIWLNFGAAAGIFLLVAREWARAEHTAFVPLVDAREAAEARRAIATALGLTLDQLPDTDEAANAALALRLPPAALLVLDEAENVMQSGGRALRDLLEALAQSPQRPLLLVTSQSDVGSPHLPAHTLVRLAAEDALLLFARNANLSETEWQRVNKANLLTLLSYVDRLPRAIELLASVRQALGDLALREDDLPAARMHYEAALAIYPAIGARLGESNVRQGLGNLALAEGYPVQAFEHHRAALEIHEAISNRLGVGSALRYMGRVVAGACPWTGDWPTTGGKAR